MYKALIQDQKAIIAGLQSQSGRVNGSEYFHALLEAIQGLEILVNLARTTGEDYR